VGVSSRLFAFEIPTLGWIVIIFFGALDGRFQGDTANYREKKKNCDENVDLFLLRADQKYLYQELSLYCLDRLVRICKTTLLRKEHRTSGDWTAN
jgi:hypothetical protein